MEVVLQLWGGILYLLAKIFLSIPKNKSYKIKWHLWGWLFYLMGIPAWATILYVDSRYMAMAVEIGGAPSIMVGLISILLKNKLPKSIDIIIAIITFGLIIIGIVYSVNDNNGIRSFSQIFEILIMIGFLVGTYLLSKNNNNGWLFFILMNTSMVGLMLMSTSNRSIFIIMQLISIIFDIKGFLKKDYDKTNM